MLRPRLKLPLCLLILGLLATSPLTARKVVIRLGTLAPEGSVWHDVLLKIRADVQRISQGQVELRIYPGGVLGDEGEMVRKMQRRGLDAVALSGGGLSRVHSSVDCLNIPMIFRSYEELDYVRERMAPELERRFAEANFKVLNWSDVGWVHFFTVEPATTPSELRQLKLWTSTGDPATEKLYKDLGFRVVPLPATDMLTALQTGLIEAIQVPPLFAMLDGTYKQAGNMIDMRWVPLIAATVIHRRAWDRIPEQYRAEIERAARDAGERLRTDIRQAGEDAVREMKARGLNVIALDAAAKDKWKTEVEEAHPKLRGSLAPADLFDEVLRLRNEFRSARAQAAN